MPTNPPISSPPLNSPLVIPAKTIEPFLHYPPPNMTSITIQEFHDFHTIDRELFSRLIINLRRDPGHSMLAIAFWLFLEEIGFPNIILKMRSLADHAISAIAEEAYIIIKFLEAGKPPSPTSNSLIQTTRGLMNSTLSFQFLHERRIRALNGISKYMEEVCSRAFGDILERSLNINISGGEGSSGSNSIGTSQRPVATRAEAGGLRFSIVQGTESFGVPIIGWNENLVPQEERTMFMTFSRGYPLTEAEIRDHITRKYGDCIESFHMEEVPPNQQSLYARVVFNSMDIIHAVLEGKTSTRFVINGKHVRIRRWVLQGGR